MARNSRRYGYLCGFAGIIVGWACSWSAFHGAWQAGRVTRSSVVIEVVLSIVPGMLIAMSAGLGRLRSPERR